MLTVAPHALHETACVVVPRPLACSSRARPTAGSPQPPGRRRAACRAAPRPCSACTSSPRRLGSSADTPPQLSQENCAAWAFGSAEAACIIAAQPTKRGAAVGSEVISRRALFNFASVRILFTADRNCARAPPSTAVIACGVSMAWLGLPQIRASFALASIVFVASRSTSSAAARVFASVFASSVDSALRVASPRTRAASRPARAPRRRSCRSSCALHSRRPPSPSSCASSVPNALVVVVARRAASSSRFGLQTASARFTPWSTCRSTAPRNVSTFSGVPRLHPQASAPHAMATTSQRAHALLASGFRPGRARRERTPRRLTASSRCARWGPARASRTSAGSSTRSP